MKREEIYGASPLFNVAERHHNLCMKRELSLLGYHFILPQQEAVKFFDGKKFDIAKVCLCCAKQASQTSNVLLNLDGPDTDSGTSFEGGLALFLKIYPELLISQKRPLVICYRTDFRTDREHEIGYNAMFNLGDAFIYLPCYANSFKEIRGFYKELAGKIDAEIKRLESVR